MLGSSFEFTQLNLGYAAQDMPSGVVISLHQLLIVVPGFAKVGWAHLNFDAWVQADQGLLVLIYRHLNAGTS